MRICSVDAPFMEELDNYLDLTYLRRSEIIHIYCRFKELGSEVTTNLHHRYDQSRILQVFPELSYNPFVDRIFHVFSSMKDDKMSFEDILDFASAFCEDCPIDVRAQWVFLIFDFDGDQLLNQNDIAEIVSRLTTLKGDDKNVLTNNEKLKIAEIILSGIVLCHTDGISCVEFVNEVKKTPEFNIAFRIKFM